jgi:hypothetical protein
LTSFIFGEQAADWLNKIFELFRIKSATERDPVILLPKRPHCLGFGVPRHEVEGVVGEGLQAKK